MYIVWGNFREQFWSCNGAFKFCFLKSHIMGVVKIKEDQQFECFASNTYYWCSCKQISVLCIGPRPSWLDNVDPAETTRAELTLGRDDPDSFIEDKTRQGTVSGKSSHPKINPTFICNLNFLTHSKQTGCCAQFKLWNDVQSENSGLGTLRGIVSWLDEYWCFWNCQMRSSCFVHPADYTVVISFRGWSTKGIGSAVAQW